MDSSPPIIEYGHRRRRQWVRWVVTFAIVSGFAMPAWHFRVPIKAWLADAYADWQFARAFDRAAEELAAGTGLWRATADDNSADQHLRSLLSYAPPLTPGHPGASRPSSVIFVRAGRTGGRQWLAFAFVHPWGLAVYRFDRDDREARRLDQMASVQGADQRQHLVSGVPDIRVDGETVTTVFTLDGISNTVEWKVVPPGVVTNTGYASPIITPRTGWTFEFDWWSDTGEMILVTGPPPPRELAAVEGSLAVAFAPDGGIALVTPEAIARVSTDSEGVSELMLPGTDRRREIAAFSPDGRWCLMGGTSEPALVVNVITGSWQSIGRVAGQPRPTYPRKDTLVLLDNVSIREYDCLTGVLGSSIIPLAGVSKIAMGGELTAFEHISSRHVQLLNAELVPQGSFPNIQGLHQMSLSPDGRWLALKGQSGIRLFDVPAGQLVWEHDRDSDFHTARSRIKWTADGTRGAAAGSRYVYVWSLKKPYRVARFPHGRTGYWPDVALSPDGRQMVASGEESASIAYWPDVDAALGLAASPEP